MGLTHAVDDAYLRQLLPTIDDYLWASQVDYSTQINVAFRLMRDELIESGIDVNRIPGTVNVTPQINGIGTAGSFDITVTSTAGYTAARIYRISQGNLVEYLYCTALTPTVITFSESLANTYTAATVEDGWVEDAFDLPLAELSLSLIARAMIREPGDRNDMLSVRFHESYRAHLAAARFAYDLNANHVISTSEVGSRSTVGSIPIYR